MTAVLIPFDRLPEAQRPKVERFCSFCKTPESKAKSLFAGMKKLDGSDHCVCGDCIVKFKTLTDEVDNATTPSIAGETE